MARGAIYWMGSKVIAADYDLANDCYIFHTEDGNDHKVPHWHLSSAQQLELGALPHGQHRQAASSHHRSPAAQSSPSPHGAAARASAPSALDLTDAIYDALNSGHISAAHASTALKAIRDGDLTHPSLATTLMGLLSANRAAQAQGQAMTNYAQAVRLIAGIASPPHEPTTLRSEAFVPGEIIAWRAWNIVGSRLRSCTANTEWEPSMPMSGDAAGGWGIHAYKGPAGPVLDGYISHHANLWVLGEVALWGDVIEHEWGYRAQFARVHSFKDWAQGVPQAQRDELTRDYLTSPEFSLSSDETNVGESKPE